LARIAAEWRDGRAEIGKDELQKYMTGIVAKLGSKLSSMNNMP
jgi:hypothetical protein